MTITSKQHAASVVAGARSFVDFTSDSTCEAVRLFRVDASKAQPINVDLAAGIPQGATATNAFGTQRQGTSGKDVVYNVSVSDACTIVLEDSPDQVTYTPAVTINAAAHGNYGLRCAAVGANWNRIRVQAPAGASVKTVHVMSQVRDLGV